MKTLACKLVFLVFFNQNLAVVFYCWFLSYWENLELLKVWQNAYSKYETMRKKMSVLFKSC